MEPSILPQARSKNPIKDLLQFLGQGDTGKKKMNNNNHDYNHNNDTKGWKIRPSKIARNTRNYIREFVETLKLTPNPDKDVIALSIGDPCIYGNIRAPQELTDAMVEVISDGSYNGYGPSSGHDEAKEALAEYMSHSGVQYEASDVLMYSGCSSALENCITVLSCAEEGHNILIPRPGFAIYRTLAESIGVKIKYYNLLPHKKFQIDLVDLEAQIDPKTSAIVINNPSNPCGSVYTAQHLRDALAIASKYKIPVIADEIYERLVFPGKEFVSMAALDTDVPLLICGGLSKRFLIPGWRLGWVVIHDPIGAFNYGIRKGLNCLSTRTIGSNTPIQGAMVKFLNNVPQSYYDDIINLLYENAKICHEMLRDVPGLNPIMPDGAMYMMVEIEKDHFPDFPTTSEFVVKLMEEESVFCLPGELTFSAGVYAGIYISQNYEVPRVDEPAALIEKIKDFADQHKK